MMVPAFSAELELMLAKFGRESSMMMRTSDRGCDFVTLWAIAVRSGKFGLFDARFTHIGYILLVFIVNEYMQQSTMRI